MDGARKRVEEISRLELKSHNTATEVKFAGEIFREAGAEKIILVSSPTHISRCLRDAYVAFSQDGNLEHFTRNLFASPSQISWARTSEVVIIEPPHRPDKPLQNIILRTLTLLFKRLYKYPKPKNASVY